MIEETVESSEDEEVPQENEVPLPICLVSVRVARQHTNTSGPEADDRTTAAPR